MQGYGAGAATRTGRLRLMTIQDYKPIFFTKSENCHESIQSRMLMCEFLLNFQSDKTQNCVCQKHFLLTPLFLGRSQSRSRRRPRPPSFLKQDLRCQFTLLRIINLQRRACRTIIQRKYSSIWLFWQIENNFRVAG